LEELQKIETEEAPVIKWKSPEVGWFKENWDVALDRTTKCMGIGIIIRDHWEMVNAALSSTVEAYPEPVAAKVMGTLRATEFCRDLGQKDIILEGDCSNVVQALNGKESQWFRKMGNGAYKEGGKRRSSWAGETSHKGTH
jgi:hypothetical protein